MNMLDNVDVNFDYRRKLFVARDIKTRRVVQQTHSVFTAHRAELLVKNSGIELVREFSIPNPHAFVRISFGIFGEFKFPEEIESFSFVSYNPFIERFFYLSDTKERIDSVNSAILFMEDSTPVLRVIK